MSTLPYSRPGERPAPPAPEGYSRPRPQPTSGGYSRPRPSSGSGGSRQGVDVPISRPRDHAEAVAQHNAEQSDDGLPASFDFYELARLLYPWLANMPELLEAFVAAYTKYSEAPNAAQLALAEMRAHDAYDRYFAGNKASDGSIRNGEQEYLAIVEGYARNWTQFGINPEVVEHYNARFIENGVSVDEQLGRLQSIWSNLELADPNLEGNTGFSHAARYYAENYGIQLSNEAIFLSAVDPEIGDAILNRRISLSQIGGAALAGGYRRTLERVEQLSTRINQQQALQFYAQAGDEIARASALARRHFDPRGRVTIDQFEDVGIFGDRAQARRLERNLASELTGFTSRQRAMADQAGRLRGLERL